MLLNNMLNKLNNMLNNNILLNNQLFKILLVYDTFVTSFLKVVIIVCVILLIINAILFIPIGVKITKRKKEPLAIKIDIFFHLFQKEIKNINFKNNDNVPIEWNDLLFSTNLNDGLKNLKKQNFYVLVLLEYARVKKLTFIPSFPIQNASFIPLVGTTSWISIAIVKRYIESTFQYVDDTYYQTIVDQSLGMMFEIELEVRLFSIVVAMVKNRKVLKKTFKKKEETYE